MKSQVNWVVSQPGDCRWYFNLPLCYMWLRMGQHMRIAYKFYLSVNLCGNILFNLWVRFPRELCT